MYVVGTSKHNTANNNCVILFSIFEIGETAITK